MLALACIDNSECKNWQSQGNFVIKGSLFGHFAFKTADRRRLSHDARRGGSRLRHILTEGEVPPGARISERDLCASLSISRTPLREALKVLAAEGLVVLLPNRGARAAKLTQNDVRELFEVCEALRGDRRRIGLSTHFRRATARNRGVAGQYGATISRARPVVVLPLQSTNP